MNQTSRTRIDEAHQLPARPNHHERLPSHRAVMSLLALSRDEEASYRQMAQAIEQEPYLAHQVFRGATSLSSGAVEGASSLQHALAIIGIRRFQEILNQILEAHRELFEESARG